MAKEEAAGSIHSSFAGPSGSSSGDNSLSQADCQRLCGDEIGSLEDNSLSQAEYQRLCGDELGFLVLATKKSDSETTVKADPKGTQSPAQVQKLLRRRSLSRDVMDPGRIASPARVDEAEEQWMRHGLDLTEAWS